VTAADVLAEAGASTSDTDLAERVLAEAEVHVGKFFDDNLLDDAIPVPAEVEDSCVLRCAVDLFARAKAPFGTQILPDGSSSNGYVVQRLGADPLAGVYALARPWVVRIGLG
jgi:hypothetical protein